MSSEQLDKPFCISLLACLLMHSLSKPQFLDTIIYLCLPLLIIIEINFLEILIQINTNIFFSQKREWH